MISWNILNAFLGTLVMMLGLPLVHLYLSFCGNVFINTKAYDASAIEYAANIILAPTQYLFCGRQATPTGNADEPYTFSEGFEYKDYWAAKTVTSIAVLPYSITWGIFTKSIAYLLSEETRQRHKKLLFSDAVSNIHLNNDRYSAMGIDLNSKGVLSSDRTIHPRRAEDANALKADKEALQAIITLFEEAQIPYWVDVGTCLGVYRHNGTIPWDNDIDIGILLPDFQNVKRLLQKLDPEKFVIDDWSSRGKPGTYLKVWVKEGASLIDIYHYAIDETNRTLNYFVSPMDNVFLPEGWRIRERKYTKPAPFDMIFPLRRAQLDGIDVYVPNKTKEYLHLRYGENIEPCMVFDPQTNSYEKDLNHPYWQ